MKSILIASNNPGKLREITAILSLLPIKLVTPAELGIRMEVTEDGATYAENALLKARAFSEASGLPVLADDSGLELAALNEAPGVHSRRFCPKPNANDADRCTYLIERLQAFPRPWQARFFCQVVLLFPNQEPFYFAGDCPGEIIPEARGENGFGYDPIFQIAGLQETMAELPDWLKNRISHRAQAFSKVIPKLAVFSAGEP